MNHLFIPHFPAPYDYEFFQIQTRLKKVFAPQFFSHWFFPKDGNEVVTKCNITNRSKNDRM